MLISCPNCGGLSTIPIAYGKPGHELEEAEKRGLVRLAGCVVRHGDPSRHCLSCQHEWHHVFPQRANFLAEGEKVVLKFRESVEHNSIDAAIDAAIRYGKSLSSRSNASPESFRSVLEARAACLRPWDDLLELIRRERKEQDWK
jgi:hypothetical protein